MYSYPGAGSILRERERIRLALFRESRYSRIMKAIGSLGVLLLLLIGSAVFFAFVTRPDFPLDRTITNRQAKSIEVTIHGKDSVNLQVERRSDGVRFEIPIRSLGWQDRLVALRLPNQEAPPVAVTDKPAPDPYIASREKEIRELRKKRDLFVKELESQTLGEMLARKRKRDLLAVEKEIKELEVAIETHQYQRKKR